MFGMVGQIRAQAGRRRELMTILLQALPGMEGCLLYVVAEDAQDEDAFWVTEAWTNQEAHAAALQTDRVRQAIAQGRPLIADMPVSVRTRPVGGLGLLAPMMDQQ